MTSARHRVAHRLGWAARLLLSAAIHTWAILIASRVPDTAGPLATALLPVISWFRVALALPDEFSQVRNAFAISLVVWLVSGLAARHRPPPPP